MFLPTTKAELRKLNWDALDVILVTGDSYIDSSFMGIALIGKLLSRLGYRVGIIGQPDINSSVDIMRLGEPKLFWGVSGGAVDSMVSNYTALNRKRRTDDYTPGGVNNRRPDRAVIVYSNLIRRYFKNTCPIVLGGIEASLRRIAHYDCWSDQIRRSILFDAKADYLVYGMGESAIVELAQNLADKKDPQKVRGLCYISSDMPLDHVALPEFEEVGASKQKFIEMFHVFYKNCDPITARGLFQKHGNRYLVHNPPQPCLSQKELDSIYDLEFKNEQHPYYEKMGKVTALDTIRFSLTSHRGCYGECNFCSIGVHQGRAISWRSEDSLIRETKRLVKHPLFKGHILDVGGPTANMYGVDCQKRIKKGSCEDKRCLFPSMCKTLKPDHSRQISLLTKLRKIEGVVRVSVGSGIRHDLVIGDRLHGEEYLRELVEFHVSGQLKVAPEHTEDQILQLMGKTSVKSLLAFRENFENLNKALCKDQYLTYYFIAAHPGCTNSHMKKMKQFVGKKLKINPRQVQVFTPLPSTYSAMMYYTGLDPFSGQPLFVEKNISKKAQQKKIIVDVH